MHNYYSTNWMIRRVFLVLLMVHGSSATLLVVTGDATQEDIVMGIIMVTLVHASHAPLDTIVQADMQVMAIEN